MQRSGDSKVSKIFSVFITAIIIGLLVFVGPVNAYQLQLSGFKQAYSLGDTINFLGKVEINSDERVPIKNVSLEVNNKIVCVFDVSGNELTSCDGIDVGLISNSANFGYGYGYGNFNGSNGNYSGYGYGYGYGYGGTGEIVYNISIETPQPYMWFGGGNKIRLITTTETQILNSRAYDVMLNPLIAGDGNFLFGYDGGNTLFWGKYNSSDHTLVGEVKVLGNDSINFIGVGTYKPHNHQQGDWTVRFYNADLPHDVGIFWEGMYNHQRWDLKYIANRSIVLRGQTFMHPQ